MSGPLGSPTGKPSTQGPKWFTGWTAEGRWVPFFPMYSALITIFLGNAARCPSSSSAHWESGLHSAVRSGRSRRNPHRSSAPAYFPRLNQSVGERIVQVQPKELRDRS